MTLLTYNTMQNPNANIIEDKFAMNFNNFDTAEGLFNTHMGGLNLGIKRSAHEAGLERETMGISSEDEEIIKKEDRSHPSSSTRDNLIHHHQQTNIEDDHHPGQKTLLPNGKKTKGRVKIKMEFIDNKLRRYTTFSKRKTGIMKKAYELSTLTGTQVMLLVASETGHVYTFATRKLQPMITSEAGKALIQTCLNSPDPPGVGSSVQQLDQRMSATGYEETELTYAVSEEDHKSPSCASEDCLNGSSYSGSDTSSPPTPSLSPAHAPSFSISNTAFTSNVSGVELVSRGSSPQGVNHAAMASVHLAPGLMFTPSVAEIIRNQGNNKPDSKTPTSNPASTPTPTVTAVSSVKSAVTLLKHSPTTATLTIRRPPTLSGGSVVVGSHGGSLVYSPSRGVVYATNSGSLSEVSGPLLLNLPPGLQLTAAEQGSTNSQLVTLPMNLASAAALQHSAAAAAVVSAAAVAAVSAISTSASNLSNESLPTDLSLHIKRENNL